GRRHAVLVRFEPPGGDERAPGALPPRPRGLRSAALRGSGAGLWNEPPVARRPVPRACGARSAGSDPGEHRRGLLTVQAFSRSFAARANRRAASSQIPMKNASMIGVGVPLRAWMIEK